MLCAVLTGFPWPDRGRPLAFMDCTGQEHRTSSVLGSSAGTSYQNTEEAQLVARVIQQLLSGPDAVQPSDIGVITPYSGQVPSAAYFPLKPHLLSPNPHVCPSPVACTTLAHCDIQKAYRVAHVAKHTGLILVDFCSWVDTDETGSGTQ